VLLTLFIAVLVVVAVVLKMRSTDALTPRGQFTRQLPAYGLGVLALAAFQYAMNRIDWLSKAAVDAIAGVTPQAGTAPTDVKRLVLTMFGLAVAAFFMRVLSRYFVFNAGRDVEFELRGAILTRLHQLGAAFYRTMPTGEIMSRATNDLVQVRLLFGFGILNIINVIFAFISAFQVLSSISVRLMLACFVVVPFVVFATRVFGKKMYAATKRSQEALGGLSERVQANLTGVRVIRSFGLEQFEAKRFAVANERYLTESLTLARLRGLFGPIAGLTSAVSVLVFFWYGASLLLRGPAQGGISPGDFFAFWSALARMTWPIIALGFAVSIVQRGRASFSRLTDIFNAVPEIADGPQAAPAAFQGALDVRDLHFKYGDREVLAGVSFRIEPGESLAIMGRTGAGKSTLASLLARLLPTPAGTVYLDSYDVTTLPTAAVRSTIGYAQQDAFLFSTTVARNIGLSLEHPDAEQPRILRAATEAAVADEIDGFVEQYETVVGERGVQLSGGQKQRIALARALVREPKILVLDDPLSAVDAKTEATILESIDRQVRARTLLLITHRVAAARRCKRIIVLDQGRIAEAGSHDELVALGGIYAIFVREQRSAEQLEALQQLDIGALRATPAPASSAPGGATTNHKELS
jgi:ATP-binding cassette, subfamily B, multidrug efflux pump